MLLASGITEWATALSTVGAVVVLLIREWRRDPSAGIPPSASFGPVDTQLRSGPVVDELEHDG